MTELISEERIAVAKSRAAQLLLAFRHGNQLAFDEGLSWQLAEDETKDLVTALLWVANEGVRKGYGAGVGDNVLRHFVRKAPLPLDQVETDEDGAPEAVPLIEAVRDGDVEGVRKLVRSTPDTTYVLGNLVQAFALLLPHVPDEVLGEVLDGLRKG